MLVVTGPSGVGKSTISRRVAATLETSVHVRIDDFTRFVVNGWVEPWLPEAAHQNDVLGRAVVAAAMQFSAGGYTTVLDGDVFPDAIEELARACRDRGMALHYAVLRCDLGTCMERAKSRDPGERLDPVPFSELHARFCDLGEYEANVVEAAGTPDQVTAAVLDALRSGRLAETVTPLDGDRESS
jgi:predicted kinase